MLPTPNCLSQSRVRKFGVSFNPLLVILLLLFFNANQVPANAEEPSPVSPEGAWTGRLKLGTDDLRAIIHITKKGDTFVATIDSPDQGAFGIPSDKVQFKRNAIQLVFMPLNAAYQGKL